MNYKERYNKLKEQLASETDPKKKASIEKAISKLEPYIEDSTDVRAQYNSLKAKLANEVDQGKKASIEADIKKLEPYVKTSENVAKASAATHAPLSSDRNVSMASKDPAVSKIVDADKKRNEAKMKDKNDPRNKSAVLKAEADVLDANTDAQESLQNTPKKADVQEASAPNTDTVDPKPANGPKLGTGTNVDRTGELKPLSQNTIQNSTQNKASAKGFNQWLASEARLYWDLKGQIRAGRKMSDAMAKRETMRIMRKMYNMGSGASVTSLRSLQATEGLSDISGDMRSDGSVARSIAKAWKKNANGYYSPAVYDE